MEEKMGSWVSEHLQEGLRQPITVVPLKVDGPLSGHCGSQRVDPFAGPIAGLTDDDFSRLKSSTQDSVNPLLKTALEGWIAIGVFPNFHCGTILFKAFVIHTDERVESVFGGDGAAGKIWHAAGIDSLPWCCVVKRVDADGAFPSTTFEAFSFGIRHCAVILDDYVIGPAIAVAVEVGASYAAGAKIDVNTPGVVSAWRSALRRLREQA